MSTSLIGGGLLLAGPPSACSSDPDRVDVFAVGPGDTVWRWSRVGATWSASGPLPPNGTIPGEGVCAISSGPGRVEVFAVEAGSRLPVWWRGNGPTFTVGQRLGSAMGMYIPSVPVAAVAASPNDIDVFAVGNDQALWWWHWNGAAWSPPAKLPSRRSRAANLPEERIAAVAPVAGRLDVFAVGLNTHLWHWSKVGTAAWRLQDLGGNMPPEGVSAVSWGPGRIDVFAASRVAGNTLLHWWSDGAAFGGPENLGGDIVAGTVSAVSHAPGRLDVFAITRGQQLAHWQWDGRTWSGPFLRGQNIPAGDVSAVVRKPHRLDVVFTGVGNTLLQWPGGGLENARTGPWVNWPSNHPTSPAGILRPDNLEELVNIVRGAERLGRNVRAVGTGWSNSDAAVTTGYVVETDMLSAELTDVISTSLNAVGAGLQLVHVEAGVKLNVLIRRLFSRGLALNTLGGSSGQSLAGALSTSVHGMDINVNRGPVPDMIRAIHLVGPGGAQHWIEPSTGAITTRQALKEALGIPDENIHYDDDWFYSVLVSMGSLGIIYSLIIEAVPRYALRQTRVNIDWTDIRASLAGGVNNPLDTNRGVQVALSPYPRGDGTRGCYLTTRNDADSTGLTVPTDAQWAAKEGVDLEIEFGVPPLITSFQIDYNLIDDGVNTVTSRKEMPEDKVAWIHDLVGGTWAGSHKGLTVEFNFNAAATSYLDFVDAALEIIRTAYRDEGLAYLGWISVRFQGRSRAYLSPQRFDQSCSVEFAAVWRTRNILLVPVEWTATPTLIGRIEAEGRKFGGIQHWGMNESINADDVARAYPRLDTWRRVRWELTKGGTITTFDSDFTRRCALSAPPLFVRNSNYNARDRTDAAVWRPSTGTWMIYSVTGAEYIEQWGRVGDIPVPGDYGGDGAAGIAVWRPSSGTWFVITWVTEPLSGLPTQAIKPESGVSTALGEFLNVDETAGDNFIIGTIIRRDRSQQWGTVGDIPVPGDYNGDGRTDFAVWRPSTGEWFIRDNLSGAVRSQQFGTAGDIPVPGDYNGDGRTDFAVWRPSTGEWFIKDNLSGAVRSQQWGTAGDIPVPRDHSGDGRLDFAVWRPSTGVWWIKDNSSGAERNLLYGQFGDVPV